MAETQRYDIGSDLHYKKLVSSLGEKENISTRDDIYSESGQKLVAKGTKINNKVAATLLKHKLQLPLDDSVEIENPITPAIIVNDINKLVSNSKTLTKLFSGISDAESIENLLSTHSFPSTIAFKLSVEKFERADLYEHSLLVLCLAYFIGCKAKISAQKLTDTLLASLLHDIGLLHIDPSYFESGKKLNSEERKFLHVHVIISNLIVSAHSQYQGTISLAVLDHHERLDGSGYPNAKEGENICIPGQILAISEVVASKFDQTHECIKSNELELLLNMNAKKLNPELYSYFSVLFQGDDFDSSENSLSESEIKIKLHDLASILKTWISLSSKQPSSSTTTQFIGQYIDTLYESLIQAGMNFESLDFLIMMIEQDDMMKHHTYTILKESAWQLSNLIEEVKRRKLYQASLNDASLRIWFKSIDDFI